MIKVYTSIAKAIEDNNGELVLRSLAMLLGSDKTDYLRFVMQLAA
jgi:hypothetical protein